MNSVRLILNTVFGIAFFSIVTGLALLILQSQVPGLSAAVEDVRCWAGVPAEDADCVRDWLEDLEKRRQALEDERERFADMVGSQDFVFVEGETLSGGAKLVVGTLYDDADSRTGIIRAFCWAIIDRGGLDPRVGLATMQSDGSVRPVALGDTDLVALKITHSDVDAIRALCPFPDPSS